MDEEDYKRQRTDQKSKLQELVRQKNKGKPSRSFDEQFEEDDRYDYNDHYGKENGKSRHGSYGKFEGKENGFKQGLGSTHTGHSNHPIARSRQIENDIPKEKRPLPLENSFGSFFGPSKRAIAPRILEEEKERIEAEKIAARERLAKAKMQKEAEQKRIAMNLKSKSMDQERVKPRMPPPPPPKAQRVKEMRDYSFLLNNQGAAQRDEFDEKKTDTKNLPSYGHGITNKAREGTHGSKVSSESRPSKGSVSASVASVKPQVHKPSMPPPKHSLQPRASAGPSNHARPISNQTSRPSVQPESRHQITTGKPASKMPSSTASPALKRPMSTSQSQPHPSRPGPASGGLANAPRQNPSSVTGKRPLSSISPSPVDHPEKRRALPPSSKPPLDPEKRLVSRNGSVSAKPLPSSAGRQVSERPGYGAPGSALASKSRHESLAREGVSRPNGQAGSRPGDRSMGPPLKDTITKDRMTSGTKHSIGAKGANGRIQVNGSEKRVLSSTGKPSAPFSSSKPPLSRPASQIPSRPVTTNQRFTQTKPIHNSRPRPSDEESEDSFVVSEDESTTFRLTPSIINLFRRQHRENHLHDDDEDDDSCMEVGWNEQRREESRSSRYARMEDEREQRLLEEEEREKERKKKEKRKRMS